MWIVVWLLLSTFVLAVAGWSYMILRQQKQAWAAFAKRHNLTFKRGTFFGPPLMEGAMGNHYVTFFIGRQDTSDSRSHRFVTVIEINLRVGLPTSAAIGTKETTGVVNILPLEFNVPPPEGATSWDKDWPARARDPGKFYAYMTPVRTEALKNVFTTKGVIALFFFDELDTLLRIETSDPLRDDKKLEKAMTRILGEADKFLPTAEERAQAEEERRARGTSANPVGSTAGPTPATVPVPEKKEFNAPLKPLS